MRGPYTFVNGERMKIDHLICDLCQAKTNEERDWEVYAKGSLPIEEQHVHMECNWMTKKGGTTTNTYQKFDVCPKCFYEVVVPFMESKGAKVREERSTW